MFVSWLFLRLTLQGQTSLFKTEFHRNKNPIKLILYELLWVPKYKFEYFFINFQSKKKNMEKRAASTTWKYCSIALSFEWSHFRISFKDYMTFVSLTGMIMIHKCTVNRRVLHLEFRPVNTASRRRFWLIALTWKMGPSTCLNN